MKKRIFWAIFGVAVSLFIAVTIIVTASFYKEYATTQIDELKNESQLVIKGLERDGEDYFNNLTFDNYRITWIKSDGSVIYDSAIESSTMENHLEREEVQEALETGYGESTRYSNSLMKQSFYVAYKLEDGTILRLSCTQNSVYYMMVHTLYPLYLVLILVLVLALILAYYISKKIVDPLNHLDLENPLKDNQYPELEPMLKRIDIQHKQLKQDKADVEQASLIRQEFTANVSHELKTPLHIISGYAELIKEGIAKEEDIPEFSSKIYQESARMTKLVEDIMQLSQLDSGMQNVVKSEVYLDAIIQNVINALTPFATERHVTLNSRLISVKIKGIPDVLYSMIYNIVDNGIKYNKEQGQVDINLEYNSYHQPMITITDTGIGIPEADLNRIFERFYRVDKSHSREIGGTGLGLSIVKHGVLVHNAHIDVDSTLGEGSTFKITFEGV